MTQLRKRMMKNMTVRGLAENKMRLYLHSVSGLARYCKRNPERISAQEVQNYLLHLHEERGLTWQICNCTRHWQTTFHHTTLCGLFKKGVEQQTGIVPLDRSGCRMGVKLNCLFSIDW